MQPVFLLCLILSASISSVMLLAGSNTPAQFAAASSQNTMSSTGFLDSEFADGLTKPTSMAFSPDGRLFVNEQGGDLRVIKNGALLEEPFLSVSVNSFTERGLNGIAFDPEFDRNGYIYVYYTTSSDPIHNRLSRFTADTLNPDVAAAGSEEVILDLEELNESLHHNGGSLNFGNDGKLYVGVGYNTNNTNPQSLSTLFGKVLRINPDGSIPSDNPFVDTPGAKAEIWAFGFRNPFTAAFRPGTSTLYVNDVGLATWEEINDVEKGGNYGWRICEGPCSKPDLIDPIYAYEHPGEIRRVIAGGTFYEEIQFPVEYRGSYFFGDFLGNYIKILTPDNEAVDFLDNTTSPVDIDIGPDGSLYYLSYLEGKVHKVTYVEPQSSVPSAPTSLSATTISSSQIDLSWTAPASNGGSPITGYKIERESQEGGGYLSLVDNTGSTSTSYSDTGVEAGVQYNYRVSAINAVGMSSPSNEAGLTMERSTVFATLDGKRYSVEAESVGAKVTAATIEANMSVTVFLSGSGEVKLKLQKIMIDGISGIMAGSQEIPFTTVESTGSYTTIEFSVPTGVNSVEITGATVVPEFGMVAVLVLATSLVVVIWIARFSARPLGFRL